MAGRGFSGTGLLGRLYRGETKFDFIGSRKKWYAASAIIILICLLSMIFHGFNYGIDFKGGDSYQLQIKPGVTLADVRAAVSEPVDVSGVSKAVEVSSAQTVTGANSYFVIKTEHVDDVNQVAAITKNLAAAGKVNVADVSVNTVSSSWGSQVTDQAIVALIVFLIAVSAFIWLRFQEWRMAGAALAALAHDLLLTAGVYSIVGFEVTPATVVGLLTILGFSLYDTVVVFDKVSENSRGLLSSMRHTYPEAANMAVNQTLMRSINTSVIGLLPVAGLLFVGAGILGVGTLEDLALVLFVGMITGAYSSLFLATPWLVDFKLMDPRYKNHMVRVLARRAATRKGDAAEPRTAPKRQPTAASKATATKTAAKAAETDADTEVDAETVVPARDEALAAASTPAPPRPGAKPANKRGSGQRPGAGRPGAKRR
jgi:preprotein translocase subunit SecF